MDKSGQILLIFIALVVTSHGRPDGLKTLPDASVFELTPPKEFLELFKPDESKKLNNPMKSPLITAMRSQNFAEMSKFLPDQSVFEMTPPKEFLDLFRLKEKENDKTENDAGFISPNKEISEVTSAPELPKASTELIALDEKSPNKTTSESSSKDHEESRTLTEPLRSFDIDNIGKNLQFPDWFYSLDIKPIENTNIDKQTDNHEVQNPHDIEWNQQTFESQSFYQPSSLGDKKLEPLNMFGFNEGPTGFHNIFIKNEDENDLQIREKDSSKITTHTTEVINLDDNRKRKEHDDVKISKSITEDNSIPPVKKPIHDEKEVKTNENSELLPNRDTVDIRPGKVHRPETRPLLPTTSVPDKSVFVPVKLVPGPQNQHYRVGNMVYMSTRYPPQNDGLPMLSWRTPNLTYRYVYYNQPIHQSLRPQNLEVTPVSHSSNDENDSEDKPNDLIISNIDGSSKDLSSSSTKVSVMLIPSKSVPQTRKDIAGNNMELNSGDKLDNVDQTSNTISPPNVFSFSNNLDTNQGNIESDLKPELNQVNINNYPNLGQPVDSNYGFTANIGQNNNNPQNFKPETMGPGNILLTNPPNPGYPVWIQPGNAANQNSYPPHQPFVNVPYDSNGVPLNYIFANRPQTNGQLTTSNYQINPGQGVVVPNPTVGGYNGNVYALVPITNDYRPNPYLSNGTPNGYQVTGPVYNLVPVPNNNMLNTRDED